LGVFQNRGAYEGMCGPKRLEITGEWINSHNEELHYMYSSQNCIRVIKSRRIRWVGM